MRLADAILLSLSVAFFIIGVHQTMTVGIIYSYFFLMVSLLLLFWYRIRRKKRKEEDVNQQNKVPSKKRNKNRSR